MKEDSRKNINRRRRRQRREQVGFKIFKELFNRGLVKCEGCETGFCTVPTRSVKEAQQ